MDDCECDGSTDGTDDIVERYTAEHKWIELLRMPERKGRHFAGKVHAFNVGYAKLKNLKYDIIANLDADISFDAEYFAFLLRKFEIYPELGVAGTPFREAKFQYDYRFTNIEHVSGACQLFRRECFEEIGRYIPIKGAGIDWVGETTARMKEWKTMTFTDKFYIHHRKIGAGKSTVIISRFRFGKQDYYLGGHPVWEVFRCLYQMKTKPYILGGLFLFSGYLWAALSGVNRPIRRELVEFRRREQIRRLKNLFCSKVGTLW